MDPEGLDIIVEFTFLPDFVTVDQGTTLIIYPKTSGIFICDIRLTDSHPDLPLFLDY